MSSLGGQWRVLRHYLSASNLNAEVEKLVQKMKPASPEQWDNLLGRLEKIVTARLAPASARPERLAQTTALEKAQNLDPKPVEKKEQANEALSKAGEAAPGEHELAPADAGPVGLAPGDAAPGGVAPGEAVPGSGVLSPGALWRGLKLGAALRLGRLPAPTPTPTPTSKPAISKSSIHARTSYVVCALSSAAAPSCLLRRAEALIDHLRRFPEARELAVRGGAVRALLRAQHRLGDPAPAGPLPGAISEALSLVGYSGPPRGPGARILSLDGGGIRGLVAIELLRELERLAGAPVTQLFDYIIGVSTGAIIAAVIGSGAGSLETAAHMYHTLSKEMFGNTSLIGGTSRLVWTHSYYDTAAWERMLRDHLGDITLTQCNRYHVPKLALVSCVVSGGARPSPFVFRSYAPGGRQCGSYPGTSAARVWEAVRASAAAPTYFDEFRLDGQLHQDGGIMVNNPTGVGVVEARLVFGAEGVRRGVVVSLGTGRPPARPPASSSSSSSSPSASSPAPAASQPATSWKDKFNKILESATDTEGVHLVVNELLPAGRYFRFNPPLLADCAMDEVDPRKLAAMVEDTRAYMRRNQHKLSSAAAALLQPRPLAARAADLLARRAALLGLTRP